MADGEALVSMIDELRSLPGRERSAVLRSLSPAERSRVTALLSGGETRPPAAASVVASAQEHALPLSDWLLARLRDAGLPPAQAQWQMTAAARAALARAARDAAAAAAPAAAEGGERRKGRSLLSAVGGLLLRGGRS